MNPPLADASEEDLLAAVRPRRWERALQMTGWILGACLAVLIISSGAWWLFSQVGFSAGSVLLGLVASFLAAVMAILVAVMVAGIFGILANRRAMPFWSELARRHGQAPLDDYEAEAREGLLRAGGPDWVVLFKGTALPRGGHRWIKIELMEAQPLSGSRFDGDRRCAAQ